MSTQLQPDSSLADLAVAFPAASRVFRRHGLDYCCHGRRPVGDACAERGLSAETVLAEIGSEARRPGDEAQWAQRDVPALVAHIVDYYHARLREELPLLLQMAHRVELRHAGKESVPSGLAEHLEGLSQILLDHLDKEEQGLFPVLLSGRGAQASGAVIALERDHEDVALGLARTRALTKNLAVPPEACPTWTALYLRLGELEAEIMDHVHLENNVLFPKALSEGL